MDWQRCLKNMGSQRFSDRSRGRKALFLLLESNESLKVLGSTDICPNIKIDDVFQGANQLLIKEALQLQNRESRLRGGSTRNKNLKVDLRKMIQKIIGKSDEGKNCISVNILVDSLEQVFKNLYLREQFGSQYYTSIMNALLMRRVYWGQIGAKNYKRLIKMSIIAYNDQIKNLAKSKVAKSIAYLISQGACSADLPLWLHTRREFFEVATISATGESNHLQESVMMMAVSFSKAIAKINRKCLCQFGENLMEAVLTMYDHAATQANLLKNMTLEFIEIQIRAHHPNGADIVSIESCAEDWNKWARLLEMIFLKISEEVKYIHKKSHGRIKEDILGQRFLEVAVHMLYQLVKMSEKEVSVEIGDLNYIPSKRMRKEVGLPVILQSFKEEGLWPWLAILSETISRFHQIIDYCMYVHLLELMSELLATSKDSLIMSYAFKCCSALANAPIPKEICQNDFNKAWQKIWDIALRTVGLNLYEEPAHETLTTILVKHQPEKQVADVINLYLSESVAPSLPSVKTLYLLLRKFPLVDNMEFITRELLLKWVFPTKVRPTSPEKLYPVEIVSGLLVLLCAKGNVRKPETIQSTKKGWELEEFYQNINFGADLMVPQPSPKSDDTKKSDGQVFVDDDAINLMKEMLFKTSEDLIVWANDILKSDVVSQEGFEASECISYYMNLLYLISFKLLDWKMMSFENLQTLGFLFTHDGLFNSVKKLLVKLFIDHHSSVARMSGTLRNMKDLYKFRTNSHISKHIKDNTCHETVNLLMNVIKDRPMDEEVKSTYRFLRSNPETYTPGRMDSFIDYISLVDSQILSTNDTVKTIACQVLGSFCCTQADIPILPLQRQVITHFLTVLPSEYKDNFPLQFQMLTAFLYEPLMNGAIDLTYVDVALNIFEELMEKYPRDMELLKIYSAILEDISRKTFNGVASHDVVVKHFCNYAIKVYQGMNKAELPSSVMVNFVKLLGAIIKENCNLTCECLQGDEHREITFSDYLLQEMDSPYPEVRLTVAANIWPMFSLQRNAMAKSRATLIGWLKYITSSCPEATMCSNNCDNSNVKCTIHCLSIIAIATPYLRKQSLYQILKFVTEHNISKEMVQRIFLLISKELQIQDANKLLTHYLMYFLEKWVLYKNIKDFPFWIICESLEEFFSMNSGLIFSTLWTVNHKDLEGFCALTGSQIPEMLQEHSANVLAFMLTKTVRNLDSSSTEEIPKTSKHVIDQLSKLFPEQTIYSILTSKNNSIFYNIFKLLFDEEEITDATQNPLLIDKDYCVCLPENNPHFYTKEMVKKSLDYICSVSPGLQEDSLMSYMLVEAPAHLRHVIYCLAQDAISAPSPSDALVALISFQAFVEMVEEKLIITKDSQQKEHIKKVITGFVRDVCFSYIRIMRMIWLNEDDVVRATSFFFLWNFVVGYGLKNLYALERVSLPLFGALVDLIEEGIVQNFKSKILKLLENLMELEPLKETLSFLGHFPHNKLYANLIFLHKKLRDIEEEASLEEELKHFITVYKMSGCCRYESLLHIKEVIQFKKVELRHLYDELERNKQSFSKYSKCLLHQFICILSRICSSTEYKLRNEAAKCLAELGSRDLRTMVLIHETVASLEVSSEIMESNALHKLTLKCLELIPKYLMDYEVDVVEGASTALHSVLNSKEGEFTLKNQDAVCTQLKLAEDFTIKDNSVTLQLNLSLLELNEADFNRTINCWIPSENHSHWITSLVTALLKCFHSNSSYLPSLSWICSYKVEFCEEIFPYLLEVILRCGELNCHHILYNMIRKFFADSYYAFEGEAGLSCHTNASRNKRSIITMLNAVNFLNLQHPDQYVEFREQDSAYSNQAHRVDYLHCAVVARNCGAFFSAIQYSTLWFSSQSQGNEPHTLKYHIECDTPHVKEILQVLRESYAGIGDTDALYGCGTSHLLEPLGRIEHFKHLDKWEQVMRSYELEVTSCGSRDNIDGLLKAIQMVGMDELLMGVIDTRESAKFDKFRFECAWRLGSWDLLSNFTERKKHTSGLLLMDTSSRNEFISRIDEVEIDKEFHKKLFVSMRQIKFGKYQQSLDALNIARSCVIDSLALTSLEACQNLYKPLTRLQAIKEIEMFANAFIISKQSAVTLILDQWKNVDTVGQESLKNVEPVMAVRLTLLQYCCGYDVQDGGFLNIKNPSTRSLVEMRLKLGQIAREMKMYSVSEKYLRAVRQVPNLINSIALSSRLELEEAKLYWAKGDKEIAKIILHNLLNKIEPLILDRETYLCYAKALTAFGYWKMEGHSDRAKVTMLNYFGQTVEMLDEHSHQRDSDEYLNAVRALAIFADEQFSLLSKYISSPSYEKKRECAFKSKYMVLDYQRKKQITQDEKYSLTMLKKQAQIDDRELDDVVSESRSYLALAISNYGKLLRYSNDSQLEIMYRFISLILQEMSNRETIEREIDLIPTFKFIPVVPQLLPRVVLSNGDLSFLLKNLIEKCAVDHPHHVLPAIFAIAYSVMDQEDSDTFITETQKKNTKAAQKMIFELKQHDKIKHHVLQLEELWEALISLAYFPVTGKKSWNELHLNHPLTKVKNLTQVQIPTIELRESLIGEYKHITSVWKYLPEFHLVGGINLPKKLTCIGSDGVKYQQLLKGQDDLRQDAVMQQVFKLMNNLLRRETEAKERGLIMRTYKVVPLSQRCGLIQWCENTTSIGYYLHGLKGRDGAHFKYYPSDYHVGLCRKMMENARQEPKSVKLHVFLNICENLQPVFRHYFFTKFPNPGIWYEMRQAYIRSVATSSMIGYVLGLGDRHLSNILLDSNTSEVIHIDLGIAFEQGKVISTPETVPFRLTRDIVDGMGISGVEGVFKRSCEVTLRIMRKYRQSIVTVLEILIYDPLYAWTLNAKWRNKGKKSQEAEKKDNSSASTAESNVTKSINVKECSPGPSKANPQDKNKSSDSDTFESFVSIERSSEGRRNPVAVRALERLELKLMGLEDGDPPSSVEAQVQKLIQEAQDPENLCCLYPGWQPFL